MILKEKIEKAQKAQVLHDNIVVEIQKLEDDIADQEELECLLGPDAEDQSTIASALKHVSTLPIGSHDKFRCRM